MNVRHLLATAALANAIVAPAVSAQETYPNRPIRLVIPFAPGGGSDYVGRLVGAKLSEQMGQQVVVDNRPGAGSLVGTEIVAKAAPDGYTLGMGPVGALAISPNMIAKVPYDVLHHFQPVVQLTRGHLLVAVAPTSSIHSIRELIAEAKKYPGKLTNASSASGRFPTSAASC